MNKPKQEPRIEGTSAVCTLAKLTGYDELVMLQAVGPITVLDRIRMKLRNKQKIGIGSAGCYAHIPDAHSALIEIDAHYAPEHKRALLTARHATLDIENVSKGKDYYYVVDTLHDDELDIFASLLTRATNVPFVADTIKIVLDAAKVSEVIKPVNTAIKQAQYRNHAVDLDEPIDNERILAFQVLNSPRFYDRWTELSRYAIAVHYKKDMPDDLRWIDEKMKKGKK